MKNHLVKVIALCAIVFTAGILHVSAQSQRKPMKVDSKSESTKKPEIDALKRPANNVGSPKPEVKSRGDVYGPDYSDIIVDNYTGYYMDIYVDGEYRGTLAPWDKKTTWALPGSTKLYAKAQFDDGSYKYWGPTVVQAGYEFTWSLKQ